jgi:KaiC/GvpD/RAD55 family RecA-like ATPase
MNYVRLCKGVKDKGILVDPAEVENLIDSNHDWYASVFYYNHNQYLHFQETKSIRGIKDVTTNKLVFDFDNEQNPDKARIEAQNLIYKLTELGVQEKDFEIYFSGNKGFNIVITLDRYLNPSQIQQLAEKIGSGIKYDTTLYDAAQILRIPGTKHQKSKLYKIPLTFAQLFNLSLDDIKLKASNLDLITDEFNWGITALPDELFEFKKEKLREKSPVKKSYESTDFTQKPSNWKNCKWSLLQGNFGHDQGERHHALTILAATCRGLGYDKESTYYLCKSALKKQAQRTGREEFGKDELWNNIIEQSIFADGWEGGQFSCKTDPWLKNYCNALGDHKCKDKEETDANVKASDMYKVFEDYALNFENNIIKIGIPSMDDHVTLIASSLAGLLGQPGAGKTSFALNCLLNTSLRGIQSMFFSLDMGLPIIYAKLVQKEAGLDFKTVMKLYKTDPKLARNYAETIDKQYRNVTFNFKSGLTVADMKNAIKERQEKSGTKVKLCIIDYLECIAGPYSDPMANSGFIANQLKDMANELNVCVLLLLQTQKHSTPDISDPLLSLKGVKGSSLIEQSCSTILTLWRDGYNPNHVDQDKYISFAVVKNRFGSLWKGDFGWQGMTGDIYELSEEQLSELKQFREQKTMEKILEAKRLSEMEDKAGGWS